MNGVSMSTDASLEFADMQAGTLRDFLASIWGRKWTILLVFTIVFGLSCWYTFTRVPIYMSVATVEIGTAEKSTIETISTKSS